MRRRGSKFRGWQPGLQARGQVAASVAVASDLSAPRRPLGGTMQPLVSPVAKAIFVALFLFAILLILYLILWYICRDVDNDYI